MSNAPSILKPEEVAAALRLSKAKVLVMARRGDLPGFKVGGVWRFYRVEIEEWVGEKRLEGNGA
jgi:excisionase family DNA binding protein